MKKKKSNVRGIVLKYYPNAKCILRPFGNEYHQIIDGNNILGQGKSALNAWTAAYHNTVD